MLASVTGNRRSVLALLGLLIVPPNVPAASPEWMASGREAMVAADSPYASAAGLEVLKAGGNAMDAATAVSFALAVTRPESTGLGGGGFLLARFADGRVVVADFREMAPAASTADMFVRATARDPQGPPPSQYGHLAAAVPGLLRGRAELLARHGTMPLSRILQPAIGLARDGFAVDQTYVDDTRSAARIYEKYPVLKETCGFVYRRHLREGRPWTVGERLHQPELARLLEGIAEQGPDFFYNGPPAEALEKTMAARGGVITAADLRGYEVRYREPLRSTYREYELLLMPPPSSGGIAIAETLNILETVDLPHLWRAEPIVAHHYLAEALKHAFADRARWLGDADFAAVPTAHLLSKAYARTLVARIQADAVGQAEAYGAAQIPDDAGTSHFCVIDRWGNCVVSTETINTRFGSLAAVDEWGLILNNEMDDFAAVPGEANIFGLRQSARNEVAARKRPLSSMSPTIVLRGGRPYLLIGGSGGPKIITSVLSVMIGVLDGRKPLEEAMTAPRLHHQWMPDEIQFSSAVSEEIVIGLKKFGHTVSDRSGTGIVQAIIVRDGGVTGACDPRKGGIPAGD
ncbi:MAG: gamma-glutamyltransferase [Phycisphaerae bacterium]|nr:gamma-glutamyltransferase [Phycisphaerae bacterium]